MGDTKFFKFWEFNPNGELQKYEKWHSYLVEKMAPGYFIHNLINHISPDSIQASDSLWFPATSKEVHKDGEICTFDE